jgi:hypothetical protein
MKRRVLYIVVFVTVGLSAIFELIGFPLPIKRIAYFETKTNICRPGLPCWEIFRDNNDSTYFIILRLWGVSNPNISFQTVLVSSAEVKQFRIKVYFDWEYHKFRLLSFTRQESTKSNGIYYYSIPKLPYERLEHLP